MASFVLRRLRVIKSGQAVYDETFHTGVNIIRGQNGSGKSTIADFIFYILGGELEKWKMMASTCHEVHAELETLNGIITLRRDIDKSLTPIQVFFGPLTEAHKVGLDGWQTFPIRRSENRESFSQIMFRASGIPEAQSQGASNITMNQLMRLLYADQRTPVGFLFKYEPFDTREIRDAVGDLVCGISGYETYEIELRLRELDKSFGEASKKYESLLQAIPKEEMLTRVSMLDQRLADLATEYAQLQKELGQANEMVDANEADAFMRQQAAAADALRRLRNELRANEQRFQQNELEIDELSKFVEYLDQLVASLPKAEATAELIGNIEFTHCPSCLTPLSENKHSDQCVLCGTPLDPEREQARYLGIKTDLEIQLREATQLMSDRRLSSANLSSELRQLRAKYRENVSEFAVKYDISISPRESFLASRFQRLGQIDREVREVERLREVVIQLEQLSVQKAELQERISVLRDRQKALAFASQKRRAKALTEVSQIGCSILKADIHRQEEFRDAKVFSLNFGDNSVLVDGDLNFAESSNVIVKNTAILSLIVAATKDKEFYHPHFVLFDNIEDKGMEDERSHNFQKIIASLSSVLKEKHQIIFTTSTIDPQLNTDDYVVGRYYTQQNRSLDIIS